MTRHTQAPGSDSPPRRPRVSVLTTAVARLAPAAEVPEFIPPQLCKLASILPQTPDAIYEEKIDGFRLQLRKHAGRVQLITRKNQDWTHRFPEIAAAAAYLPDCTLDGEVAAFDKQDRSDLYLLQAALGAAQTAGLVYLVFDVLFIEGRDVRPLPLVERKEQLARLFSLYRPPPQIVPVPYKKELKPLLTQVLRKELEGVVRKRVSAPYASAARDSWLKIKNRRKHSVFIGGWIGNRREVHQLVIGMLEGKRLRFAGCVQHGFRSTEPYLLAQLSACASARHPFIAHGALPEDPALHWVYPRLQIEVEAPAQIAARPLRNPVYQRLLR